MNATNAPHTDAPDPPPAHGNFRKFFVRGLGILLPSILTIWILVTAYQFVQSYIAQPINVGVRAVLIQVSPWPRANEQEVIEHRAEVMSDAAKRKRLESAGPDAASQEAWLRTDLRRQKLVDWWDSYALVLDLIGLVVAIVLIYTAGLVVGSFIGRHIYHRGEQVIHRLPLVGRVYPAVKQVTDFFVGDASQRLAFNRVVAVQYPRKGIWSVGMVTGSTMRAIESEVGADCLTIFVPSSPTPFTGYVITVPKSDTIDLPITIEDALKFAVSGGVLIPPNQVIEGAAEADPSTEPAQTSETSETSDRTTR